MKNVFLVFFLVTLACCFIPTSVYLQAIDRIIQKLVDSLEPKDFQVLCENVECYNEHALEFLQKLKARDPSFRNIAIEHCRVGKPEFPEVVDIHGLQQNLGWNETQAAYLSKLFNETRHLWTTFFDVCHDEDYTRYLDKFSPEF